MLSGLNFYIPALFLTWGTLVVGGIPLYLAWYGIDDHWRSTGKRKIPKAFFVLTASLLVDFVGFAIFGFLLGWLTGYVSRTARLGWLISLVLGFLLDLAALFMSCERNVSRVAVVTGSLAVAVVNATGFICLFIATHGSPLSY